MAKWFQHVAYVSSHKKQFLSQFQIFVILLVGLLNANIWHQTITLNIQLSKAKQSVFFDGNVL